MTERNAQFGGQLVEIDNAYNQQSGHITFSQRKDYYSELALGNIPGRSIVNKFGAAPNGVQDSATDIWDRADATPTQQIWVAPTQARVHAVASTSAADTSGSTGATSVIVYGLPDWDTPEVNETVNLSGTTPVNTANSYVIIHRMKCVAQATTTTPGVSAGNITATAATDNTVTAAILAGNGQTEMAIYGVPSTHTALMHRWAAQLDRSVAVTTTVNLRLRVNENPDVQLLGFLRKDDISLQVSGSSFVQNIYQIPKKFAGPCIIKIQGVASTTDIDVESEFDLELVRTS